MENSEDWNDKKLNRVLSSFSILNGSQALIPALISNSVQQHFQIGDVLANQGDLGHGSWLILKGKIGIVINGHSRAERVAGCIVGEMAVIDPTQGRSADMICLEDSTHCLYLTDDQLFAILDESREFWQAICKIQMDRLRERDAMIVPPNEISRIFVASAGEEKPNLNAVVQQLESFNVVAHPWTKDGAFRPNRQAMGELYELSQQLDFAIVLATQDDFEESRGELKFKARDNVWLEYGLFLGALGMDRTFILLQRDRDMKMPSDTTGITVFPFVDLDSMAKQIKIIMDFVESEGPILRLR
jgi:CRP/FNR family cyclic AMP-dependent transcriptional regulator